MYVFKDCCNYEIATYVVHKLYPHPKRSNYVTKKVYFFTITLYIIHVKHFCL